MKLSEAKSKGFYELKLDLAEVYQQFAPGDVVLTFREPTEDESLAIMKERKDTEAGLLKTARIWVELLENWTLEDDSDERLPKDQVIAYISKMSGATTFINRELWTKLPLAQVTGTGSGKSPVSTSEGRA